MKSAYVKPTMMFEGFQPTEYVAACYTISCMGSYFYENGNHDCNGETFVNTGSSDTDYLSEGVLQDLYVPAAGYSLGELFVIWLCGDDKLPFVGPSGYYGRWEEFAAKYLNNQPAGQGYVHSELGGHILSSQIQRANYPNRPNHS